MVWYFIGIYIINRTSHGRLDIRDFSSSGEKYLTSERSERVKYFFNTNNNINMFLHYSLCIIYCGSPKLSNTIQYHNSIKMRLHYVSFIVV